MLKINFSIKDWANDDVNYKCILFEEWVSKIFNNLDDEDLLVTMVWLVLHGIKKD